MEAKRIMQIMTSIEETATKLDGLRAIAMAIGRDDSAVAALAELIGDRSNDLNKIVEEFVTELRKESG